MLIPGENMWSRSARGGLYLFCLLYTFLGIAIVADVFMNAIEVVTSKTKTVSSRPYINCCALARNNATKVGRDRNEGDVLSELSQ